MGAFIFFQYLTRLAQLNFTRVALERLLRRIAPKPGPVGLFYSVWLYGALNGIPVVRPLRLPLTLCTRVQRLRHVAPREYVTGVWVCNWTDG